MASILITGASRGIGFALTQIYAQRGDTVFACCRAPLRAEALQVLAQLQRVRVMQLDVADAASVTACAKALSDERIDTLINNAGIIGQPRERQCATSMDFALWSELLNVNTMGPVRVMHAFLRHLKRSAPAKVMNVTSDLGALSHDDPMFFGYSASKAALNKYMRLAALELKREGVAIGLIHPGWVQTDMGGNEAPIAPMVSAAGIIDVIDRLSLESAGGFWKWNGTVQSW